jgi:hypothetical protein
MNPLQRLFGNRKKKTTTVSPVEAAIEIVADAIHNNNTNNTMASSTIGTTSPAAASVDHGGPVVTMIVQYLLGTSYMTAEWQALTMAIQGCMIVRNTLNKDGKTLQWFHALVLSILYGFAGGLLGFVWLGKPSSLLSAGDINLGACILAYIIVNHSPFDIGYQLLSTPPLTILYTSGAQLFRTTGIIRFVTACYNEFKHAPSPYYPIPVLGPILYGTVRLWLLLLLCLLLSLLLLTCCCACGGCCGRRCLWLLFVVVVVVVVVVVLLLWLLLRNRLTHPLHFPSPVYTLPTHDDDDTKQQLQLLGNMSGFLFKGVEGHVKNGVPWPMQNGLFCATLYHFIVHDTTGIIGTTLRQYCYPTMLREMLGYDDKTFAGLFVSIFMQVTGLLQLPNFYGPTFSPFEITGRLLYQSAAVVVIPMTGGSGKTKKKTSLDTQTVDDVTTTTTGKKHNNNTNHNNNNKSKNKKKEL